jgi:hypothetical protein
MLTISLHTADSFSESFYDNYSKFKHGSKTQARIFGRSCAEVFPMDCFKDKTIIFYPAPYKNIPTASSSFKDYLIGFATKNFLTHNIKVKQGKIHRAYSYDNDYGKMSKEERAKAISSDMFSIDKEFISPDDVLVFIDDIRITGSHEDRINELMQREGIKNEYRFIYIANYIGHDPSVEHRLNHAAVNNLKDVNNIIRNEEFIFNTRVTKYILGADIEHFVSFITYQSDTFRETLFTLSVLNEYHTNKKYSTNFNILKDLL